MAISQLSFTNCRLPDFCKISNFKFSKVEFGKLAPVVLLQTSATLGGLVSVLKISPFDNWGSIFSMVLKARLEESYRINNVIAPISVKLFPVRGTETVELVQTPTFPRDKPGGWACRNKLVRITTIIRDKTLMVKLLKLKLVFV